MKLASYLANGKACFGVVSGDGVVTLNERLGGRYATLRDVLAADGLAEIAKAADGAKPDHTLAQVSFFRRFRTRKRFSAPASTTVPMPPRPAANCPSSRACSSASPIR
jgi:hypothetical protein